jgi:hypothetical protein
VAITDVIIVFIKGERSRSNVCNGVKTRIHIFGTYVGFRQLRTSPASTFHSASYKRAGDKLAGDATAPCSPPAIGVTFS